MRAIRGQEVTLPIVVRGFADEPTDADQPPRATFTDAAGALVFDDLPSTHVDVGLYELTFVVPAEVALGVGEVSWAVVLDGENYTDDDPLEVALLPVAAAAGELYGAVRLDVQGLLPHRAWTADSPPTLEQVDGFLTSVAGAVDARIGPLPEPNNDLEAGRLARLTGLARRAVILGAAAHAEAAGAPERARPNDASSYATWLWDRYKEALEAAGIFADTLAPGDDPAGVDPVDAEPGWSFPEPVGWAARGL